jgi:hypothetical protein
MQTILSTSTAAMEERKQAPSSREYSINARWPWLHLLEQAQPM